MFDKEENYTVGNMLTVCTCSCRLKLFDWTREHPLTTPLIEHIDRYFLLFCWVLSISGKPRRDLKYLLLEKLLLDTYLP